ncbi:hypothetical protein TI04_00030 [Achromatium sp. WMS2]|nr:hypothetical protein TI04_00030 [Achromatium sp. WMS2]
MILFNQIKKLVTYKNHIHQHYNKLTAPTTATIDEFKSKQALPNTKAFLISTSKFPVTPLFQLSNKTVGAINLA